MSPRGATITGWGSALPDTVLTNADLEARLDTTDEWIFERSGIKERRIGGLTSTLSIEAARKAMASAGVEPAQIDLLVLATTTPDQRLPGTSAHVQHELGLRCGAFDLQAACSGFVYALVTGHAFVGLGYDRILVIGTDALHGTLVDPDDRGTVMLFGDGSGAVVLEAVPGEGELLGWDLGCDGSARDLLYCNHGSEYAVMDGKEVFRKAVRVMVDSGQAAMERAKVTPDDIKLLVPHQANVRIIEAANKRLGIPMERTAMVIEKTGNTSAASIPLALVDAVERGRLENGDLVLMCGFGAGMTWASAVIRWGR